MRELKFRAWDIERKEMEYDIQKSYDRQYEDEPFQHRERCFWEYMIPHFNYKADEEEQRYHVMQYTGIKDRQGRDIYEGDILGGTWNGRILWCPDCASFALFFGTLCAQCYGDVWWREVVDEANQTSDTQPEVIGNIYENPELEEAT